MSAVKYRTMHFHMHLLPTYFADKNSPWDVYYREVLEQVQLAEELGWECFWFTEHHFLPYGGGIPNPAVMLSGVAARTSRIRIGSAISILPLHHPVQVAEDYAMVDVVSRGRLEFGVGLGNTGLDYQVYGVDREESRARFEESVDVILDAWTQERLLHVGPRWRVEGVSVLPRPVQQPHPPVWYAGASAESFSWAGRRGYNIMTVAHAIPPERYRESTNAWQEALKAGGHDRAEKHCKLHVRCFVDENADRAREIGQGAINNYEYIGGVGRERRVPYQPGEYPWETMLAQGRNNYGTPEQCIEGIKRAREHFHFDIYSTTFNYGGI